MSTSSPPFDWIQLLSQYDNDNDGYIDYDEWRSFCESKKIDNKDEIWTKLLSSSSTNESKLKIKDIASMLNKIKV